MERAPYPFTSRQKTWTDIASLRLSLLLGPQEQENFILSWMILGYIIVWNITNKVLRQENLSRSYLCFCKTAIENVLRDIVEKWTFSPIKGCHNSLSRNPRD